MSEPDALPPLRDVIAKYDLAAKKSLGQNFLLDLNLTGRIARAAGDLTTGSVIEIGPGPGGLTRALLLHGAKEVIVVERDDRCLAALEEIARAYPRRLRIIAGDALATDVAKLGPSPRRIVANLPYNIATPLLIGWLTQATAFQSMTLMFQKEVVERLVAKPRTKDYGRLSVLTQWLSEPRRLFDVPPRAFTPPPKVTSSIVQIMPRPSPAYPARLADLERVTQAAFGQRRKMLRQSLRSLFGEAEAVLTELSIPPTARAEELTVEQFCALARRLEGGVRDRRPG
ncbi:16S rRNA (adenine(1518)-N(6)/adenine(1519)-N(6))-dimethyltransferase RsmA [Dongia soli]|uniref:Ribosomal RNA small subunit methyltransferase A n=1 Tax=Dongia soli TaxID=600628 RepID=A0ABU5ECI3_9PROT|nr:16S rRNA (adenine(1518)-N(6)/adenine(1519)-N(6))-dimethyltransferase RsmA [Dongia soli]MDY0884024.1 16S rRNA (adenine(1518)-N(6)/adenine(1519)-N(6))-dimethyltransferase RsmA [Dongia soli]